MRRQVAWKVRAKRPVCALTRRGGIRSDVGEIDEVVKIVEGKIQKQGTAGYSSGRWKTFQRHP